MKTVQEELNLQQEMLDRRERSAEQLRAAIRYHSSLSQSHVYMYRQVHV
jgi:acyl-coenzyme A synthetase/AMP-(fatty) acid ligase